MANQRRNHITKSPLHITDVAGLRKQLDPVKVQDLDYPLRRSEILYYLQMAEAMMLSVPYGKELAAAYERAKELADRSEKKYRKGYASPETIPLLEQAIAAIKPVIIECVARWRAGDATKHKIAWPYKRGIPAHTRDGYLPPGTWCTTWLEFVKHFGYNEKRRHLIGLLDEAFTELEKAYDGAVHIAGSFVTTKQLPNDTDVCWFDQYIIDPSRLDPIFKNKPALMERWLLDNPVHKLLHGLWRVGSLKPWENLAVFGEMPTMFCIGMLEIELPRQK